MPNESGQTPAISVAPSVSSVGVVSNFRGDDLATQLGAYGSDNQTTPPDTTLGMGNGFVVEPLNRSLSIFDTAGRLLAASDLNAFWSPVLPPGHSISDPQAVFDGVTSDHRFYMSILGFDETTFDSEILLAVSQTSDPTGNWSLYSTATTIGVLHDQPLLGISDDKLTISVNDFNALSLFTDSSTIVFNKADVDAGSSPHFASFGPDTFWRPDPVRSTSSTTTQFVVAYGSSITSSLEVMAITGVPSASTTPSRTTTTLSISQSAMPPDAAQPGLPGSIQTNDPGPREAVWQSGTLWLGSNEGCTPSGDSSERSCLRLLQVTAPTTGTISLAQDFDVSANAGYLYYPGVALDQNANLYVAFSFSNTSNFYPSGKVLALTGGDPNTLISETLWGGSRYQGFDPSPYRWGDYSGAAIDPDSPGDVWVATEFGGGDTFLGSGTNWATQLSEVTISPFALQRSYHPQTPSRILDTRVTHTTLHAGSTLNVQVTGPQVPADATAAVLNVTATNPTAQSFLTVWPAGQTRPTASNLNFVAGETVPNLAEVGIGSGGQVSVYNAAGSVDLVIDLEGYVGPSSTPGTGLYKGLTPARIADTRVSHTTLGPGGVLNVAVGGMGGVPASGVGAAVLNVTATNPTNQSFLTVWPTGQPMPLASNVNFSPGETVPNRVQVQLGTGGAVSIYNAAGNVDVVVDVGGYFTNDSNAMATGAQFTPTSPVRIKDTRISGDTLGPSSSLTVPVAGADGLPGSGLSAAVMNATVTNTTKPSFLTVWPAGVSRPLASDLNWVAGETVPNLVVARLGSGGAVQVFNAAGNVDVVVDVSGWYS